MLSKSCNHSFIAKDAETGETFFVWLAFGWARASLRASRIDKTICEYIDTVYATVECTIVNPYAACILVQFGFTTLTFVWMNVVFITAATNWTVP